MPTAFSSCIHVGMDKAQSFCLGSFRVGLPLDMLHCPLTTLVKYIQLDL